MVEHLAEVVRPEIAPFCGDEYGLGLVLADGAAEIFADQPHFVGTLVADGSVVALGQPHVWLSRAAEHAVALFHGLLMSKQYINNQRVGKGVKSVAQGALQLADPFLHGAQLELEYSLVLLQRLAAVAQILRSQVLTIDVSMYARTEFSQLAL